MKYGKDVTNLMCYAITDPGRDRCFLFHSGDEAAGQWAKLVRNEHGDHPATEHILKLIYDAEDQGKSHIANVLLEDESGLVLMAGTGIGEVAGELMTIHNTYAEHDREAQPA